MVAAVAVTSTCILKGEGGSLGFFAFLLIDLRLKFKHF